MDPLFTRFRCEGFELVVMIPMAFAAAIVPSQPKLGLG